MSNYATEEDWMWYESLPDALHERITRLFDLNKSLTVAYKKGYKNGYKVGYNRGLRKFKELVVIHEHGENYDKIVKG